MESADESAFTELIRRHGRLVWTVCRTQTGSDTEADDAFQATFLVLLQNANKVRDAAKLSAWLHGVAFKVCSKARRGTQRRTAREQATAQRETNGHAVSESAWDRALAAVHEEVAKLPETLRVPFVLCCLEGKGVTEAAEQLGWKLGTLSGRLTRAKDAVLAKLDARGLTLGVVATVGLAVPPASVIAKAADVIHLGAAVPASILQLTHGVIGMSMTSVKVLAATVLLACGFGLSVGSGWVATAEAQAPAEKAKPDDAAEVKRLKAELETMRATFEATQKNLAAQLQGERAAADRAAHAERAAIVQAEYARAQAEKERYQLAEILAGKSAPEDTATFKTARNEYNLIPVTDVSQTKFKEMVERYEAKGWEYCGTTPLTDPKALVWMFRRPLKMTGTTSAAWFSDYSGALKRYTTSDGRELYTPLVQPSLTADEKALEAEIAKLTAKLAELKAKKTVPTTIQVTFDKTTSPIDPTVLASVLGELGKKKFGGAKGFNVAHVNGVTTVFGEKEVIDWANEVVKSLGGKK